MPLKWYKVTVGVDSRTAPDHKS